MRMTSIAMAMIMVGSTCGPAAAVTVKGTPTCEVWNKLQDDKDGKLGYIKGNPQMIPIIHESIVSQYNDAASYLRGFLSSYNVYGSCGSRDVLDGISLDQIKDWMSTYCRSHPLNNLIDGAQRFIKERNE